MGELLGRVLCLPSGGDVAHEGAQSLFVSRYKFYPYHNTELQIRVVESTTRAIEVDVISVEGSIVYGTARVWRNTSTFPSDLIFQPRAILTSPVYTSDTAV